MEGATAMTEFLTSVAAIVTQILAWIPEVTGVIVDDPFLLFTVGFLAVGGAVGIIGRLLSRNQFLVDIKSARFLALKKQYSIVQNFKVIK